MTNLSTNSQYSNYAAPAAPTSSTLARRDFLDRVAFTTKQIDELPNLIGQLGRLHSEALNSAQSSPPAQLEGLITQIQQQNNQIRDSIKYLESDTVRTGDNNLLSVKNPQVKNLKNRFNQQLEAYRREEIDYKNKYQVQIAREYRIVNPNATEQEVEQASQMDWGNEGVFQQAVSNLS
jgi:syntaxin 1B/2/3